MEPKNKNLSIAKKEKNDEFYTSYEDIEKQIKSYYEYDNDVFKDKVIYCPCDDYDKSNFVKYFIDNFEKFGLSKLYSTSYNENGKGKFLELTSGSEIKKELECNGDFSSEECTKIRDKSDIIITNPPFSIVRKFFDWVCNKKFIFIGTLSMISYKNFFPFIKNNKMWLGNPFRNGNATFTFPDEFNPRYKDKVTWDGSSKFVKFRNCVWFTNINYNKDKEPMKFKSMKENISKINSDECYKKYDNFDAIEVTRTSLIPSDYTGIMGVPLSFMEKYQSDKFEIIGLDKEFSKGLEINGNKKYTRILIKNKNIDKN